jgi:predicted transcriptional regulator
LTTGVVRCCKMTTMVVKKPLGDLELEVLQFVSARERCTVRDVAEDYGENRGLARTTILTVMERLRKKGYLARRKHGGSFVYSPAHEQSEVMQGIVKDFVEKTLGGSLTPFMAYLADSKSLTREEIAQLKELVEENSDEP